MNDQTHDSDHGKQNKARRKGPSGRVVNDHAKKVDANQRRQFGLAGVTRTERIGNFDNVNPAPRRKNHVDKDLETIGRQAWSQTRNDLSPNHKEATHWIANSRSCNSPEEPGSEIAQPLSRRGKTSVARVSEPGSNHQIAGALGEGLVHRKKDGFVMLKIAVDDRDKVRAGRHPSLNYSASQTRAVDAPQAAKTTVCRREPKRDIGGSVGGVVIDDNHLPWHATESRGDTFEKNRDVLRFFVCRDDDRKCGNRPVGRRIASHSTPHYFLGVNERYLPAAPA